MTSIAAQCITFSNCCLTDLCRLDSVFFLIDPYLFSTREEATVMVLDESSSPA